MAGRLQPNAWFRFHLKRHPAAAGTDVHRWGTRPLAVGVDGFVEGRATSHGVIHRSLSDASGNWVRGRASVELADTDRWMRTALTDEQRKFLFRREGLVYIQSEEGRYTGGTPFKAFHGIVDTSPLGKGMRAGLSLSDWIGSYLSPFDPDRLLFSRRIERNVFGSDLPSGAEAKIQPVIIGRHSDSGTVDTAGVSIAQGRYIPKYAGKVMVPPGAIPSEAPVIPPPPAPIVASTWGTPTGTHSWQFCGAVVTKEGGRSTIGPYLQVDNMPDNGDFTDDDGFLLRFVTTYTAEQLACAKWIQIFVRRTGTSYWHNLDGSDPPSGVNFDHRIDGDDAFDKTYGPRPQSRNTAYCGAAAGGSRLWTRLLISAHAIHPDSIEEAYRPFWAEGAETSRELIPDAAYGDTVLLFGKPGWENENGNTLPYVDITDSVTGRVHRCAVMYVRGQWAEMHEKGEEFFALNLCAGMEDAGDGTGDPLRKAFFVKQHLYSEFLAANSGEGYYSGLWVGMPYFVGDPTVPMIDSDAIQYAQTWSINKLGGLGFTFDYIFEEEWTVGQFEQMFNTCYDCLSGPNEHWAATVKVYDDTRALTFGNPYRQGIEVISLEGPEVVYSELETRTRFRYDWHSSKQVFRSGIEAIEKTQYSEAYLGAIESPVLDLKFIQDPAVARFTMGQRNARRAMQSVYQRYQTYMVHKRDDLGSQILLTHDQGLGASGYVERPFMPVSLDLHPRQGTYTMRAYDMGPYLARTMPTLGDETLGQGVNLGDETSTEPPPVGAYQLR